MDINLPETDLTATIQFQNRKQADEFARQYSRRTLRGHVVSGSSVKVWNVTDSDKSWIDQYVAKLN